MNDSVKDKIVYAITLLATLFTIQPIIAGIKPIGFDLLTVHITVAHLYYLIGALLGGSVYFYSINFVTERFFTPFQQLGNILYASAILSLPLFLALWASAYLVDVASRLLNLPQIQSVGEGVLSSIIAVATALLAEFVQRRLSRRDRSSRIQTITNDEADHIQRAHQMLEVGHCDLSILESYRAVEAALRRQLFKRQIHMPIRKPRDLADIAMKYEILPASAAPEVNTLRRMRNDAVHSDQPMSRENARAAFDTARNVLSLLDKDEDEAQQ